MFTDKNFFPNFFLFCNLEFPGKPGSFLSIAFRLDRVVGRLEKTQWYVTGGDS
jgi:hypothetical protein